jgi:GNAT superfamily N-acetyltransferase
VEALSLRDEPLDGPAARSLMAGYEAELAGRYPGWDLGAGVPLSPEDVLPPAGRFVVAYAGQEPVGCGALKRLDDRTCEVKRVYATPAVRGRGVGRAIMAHLETVAAESGYDAVRLDTGDRQPDAVALYLALGYREIEDYNGNPWARHWMEKRL